MEADNPFNSVYNEEQDKKLVAKAINGNRKALNQLLEKHNIFIYNIVIKMVGHTTEAEDITQDILIKITTNLAKYDPQKGRFTSWLYKLTFNYILDYKKSPVENRISSFTQFFDTIESLKDEPIAVENGYLENEHPYTQEVKTKCTNGMLMCLSREQRLLYVVGELFQIEHTLGAEIFGTSKENFRKKLSRVRKDLYEWMNDRCGLVNKANPCRCNKKTKGFIERGIVDPENLLWTKDFKSRIHDYSKTKLEDLQKSSDKIYTQLYQEHPMKIPKTSEEVLNKVLGDKNLKELLDI
ncbi:MAG: RNA polymerase sigma factor [Bacteroidota bacterium]